MHEAPNSPDAASVDERTSTRAALAGALSGHAEAWESLLRRVDARLAVLARFRAGERGVGPLQMDDLLQEVHVEMVQSLASFEYRGGGSLQRWAAAILNNKLRNARRKELIRPSYAADLTPAEDPRSSAPGLHEALAVHSQTPSRLARDNEAIERVRTLLLELRTEQREALLLRIYEGLSNREAARRAGVADSVLSERYYAALRCCGVRLAND